MFVINWTVPLKKKEVEKLNTLKEEKQNHLNEASLRYELERQDKVNGRETQGSRVIMSDLQKCLPTPRLEKLTKFLLQITLDLE